VEIFVRETPAGAAPDHSVLVDAVARVAGTASGRVVLRTRCARCGSAGHGKPLVESPLGHDGLPFQTSLSRSGSYTVVAVSTDAPVGVDIEGVADIARASIDAALHASELRDLAGLPARDRAARLAVLWTAKEAVLKATAVGLNLEPSLLELRVEGRTVELVGWPEALPVLPGATGSAFVGITLFELPGIVGAVAVLCGDPAAEARLVPLP
jgi:hypothetical protein